MNNPLNKALLSTLKGVLSALWSIAIFFPMLILLCLLFVAATLRAVFMVGLSLFGFEIVRKRPVAGSAQ